MGISIQFIVNEQFNLVCYLLIKQLQRTYQRQGTVLGTLREITPLLHIRTQSGITDVQMWHTGVDYDALRGRLISISTTGIQSKEHQFQVEKSEGTLKGETSELGFEGHRELRPSRKRTEKWCTLEQKLPSSHSKDQRHSHASIEDVLPS